MSFFSSTCRPMSQHNNCAVLNNFKFNLSDQVSIKFFSEILRVGELQKTLY